MAGVEWMRGGKTGNEDREVTRLSGIGLGGQL